MGRGRRTAVSAGKAQLSSTLRALLSSAWLGMIIYIFFILFFIQNWAKLYSKLRAWNDFPIELFILIFIWAQPELFQFAEWDVEVDDFNLSFQIPVFLLTTPSLGCQQSEGCSLLSLKIFKWFLFLLLADRSFGQFKYMSNKNGLTLLSFLAWNSPK